MFHKHLVKAIGLLLALWAWSASAGQMTLLGVGKPAAGGFTPSCSQSSAFLAAATTVTLTADKTRYDTLICGLVSDGVWNFDALYIWAAPDQTSALINLANPGTFNGTTHGTVSFSAYNGYTGDTSTFYIDTGFNPTTATTPNYTQNSASYGAYVLTSRITTHNWWAIGNASGSSNEIFSPLSGGAGGNAQLNSTSSFNLNNANAQGAFNITRTTSSQELAYINSAESAAGFTSDTSSAPVNTNIIFFAFSTGFGWTGDQMAAGWVSKGLAATDSCKINNRINTYMQTLTSPINVYSNSAC